MFATLAPAHLVREDEKEYNVWPISSIMHEWVKRKPKIKFHRD